VWITIYIKKILARILNNVKSCTSLNTLNLISFEIERILIPSFGSTYGKVIINNIIESN